MAKDSAAKRKRKSRANLSQEQHEEELKANARRTKLAREKEREEEILLTKGTPKGIQKVTKNGVVVCVHVCMHVT